MRKAKTNSTPLDSPEVLYRNALLMLDPIRKRPTSKTLRRSRDLLTKAIRLRPNLPAARALSAYIQADLGNLDAAVREIRLALDLESDNATYRRLFLEFLDRAGRDRELRTQMAKAAALEGVDITFTSAELRKSGMATDASTLRLNVFPGGKLHFESEMLDALERLRGPSQGASDGVQALDARRAVRIDGRKVPGGLRMAIDLAKRWGIPDDVHRSYLIRRINSKERRAMKKVLSIDLRRRINAWLDSFEDASVMTAEAVHYMYLLEAFDEIFQPLVRRMRREVQISKK